MPVFTDQTGHTITLAAPARRIISLVPSQTELLADLGLTTEVVGITQFCIHPAEWYRNKTRVGGTKRIKPAVIHSLQPDLVIANKEENVKEQVEELAQHYPVWTSDIAGLPAACQMIEQIGALAGQEQAAATLLQKVRSGFASLPPAGDPLPACYLVWRNPYMTVGGDTFIHAMMQAAGFRNVFAHTARYPGIRIGELHNSGCRVLLLPSEPFPFKQQHAEELQQVLPEMIIRLVDGELFSWYGSRLQYAPAYFTQLHTEIKQHIQ